MNAFEQAKGIEARALERLLPLIDTKYDRFVLNDKGALAPMLQDIVGDISANCENRIIGIEIKAEQHHTGNLFLETWGNRNLDSKSDHAERGSNTGWLFKTRADLLFYYFLDVDRLYILDMFRLKQWAFGGDGRDSHIYSFKEKPQGKYKQGNDTHGRLVPVDTLSRAGIIRRTVENIICIAAE